MNELSSLSSLLSNLRLDSVQPSTWYQLVERFQLPPQGKIDQIIAGQQMSSVLDIYFAVLMTNIDLIYHGRIQYKHIGNTLRIVGRYYYVSAADQWSNVINDPYYQTANNSPFDQANSGFNKASYIIFMLINDGNANAAEYQQTLPPSQLKFTG